MMDCTLHDMKLDFWKNVYISYVRSGGCRQGASNSVFASDIAQDARVVADMAMRDLEEIVMNNRQGES